MCKHLSNYLLNIYFTLWSVNYIFKKTNKQKNEMCPRSCSPHRLRSQLSPGLGTWSSVSGVGGWAGKGVGKKSGIPVAAKGASTAPSGCPAFQAVRPSSKACGGTPHLHKDLDPAAEVLGNDVRVESLDLPLVQPLGVPVGDEPELRHPLFAGSLGGWRQVTSGPAFALWPETQPLSCPRGCPHGLCGAQ